MSTVVNESPVTVVKMNLSTVVRETTSSIGIKSLEQTSSSEAVYKALSQFGTVDDDVLQSLTASCKQAAPDCTDDEIVHFISEKGAMVRAGRINNPIGFLLTAVPKCFSGDTFRLFREKGTQKPWEWMSAEERTAFLEKQGKS
jgi:hypothetical protein